MSIIFYVNKFCRNNQYIYQYKDHLGNTRVSFGKNSAGDLEIVDANDYYTMGNMNYAADGYIYDDSVAGGGKPIENGKMHDIAEVTMTHKPSVGRQTWNFVADNLISPPMEGVSVIGHILYGSFVAFPQQAIEKEKIYGLHVEMDVNVLKFKNGSLKHVTYKDGDPMTEAEQFEAFAKPGVEAMTAGVAFGFNPFTKLGTVGNAVGNWGANTAVKTALKKGIYQLGPKKDKK
ncbi:hypothetical protein [Chryseobacterium gambrini]|uniref:hypothetical protein n=1 Tax=Chryseobacterium gambrini TaxID=373672 RepID=UPI0022F1C2C1|nr:hypothetical protein [Chryseobacterium gambrini]WBV54309.1 hypothetical protein PFY09_08290 [Chryseobacterium gambrini]